MNCIIYHKKEIIHYIESVIVDGLRFSGTNKRVSLGTKHPFKIKFTNEYLLGPLSDIDPEKVKEAPFFNSVPVDSRVAVNAVIRDQISRVYANTDETKLLRLRLSGKLSDDEWSEYDAIVSEIVENGKQFKDKHFPKGTEK